MFELFFRREMRAGLSKLARDAKVPRNQEQQEAFTTPQDWRNKEGNSGAPIRLKGHSSSRTQPLLQIHHSRETTKGINTPKGSLFFSFHLLSFHWLNPTRSQKVKRTLGDTGCQGQPPGAEREGKENEFAGKWRVTRKDIFPDLGASISTQRGWKEQRGEIRNNILLEKYVRYFSDADAELKGNQNQCLNWKNYWDLGDWGEPWMNTSIRAAPQFSLELTEEQKS